MHSPRDFAATVRLADGRVLVSGGRTGIESTSTATAEIFDPATRTWTLTGSMPVATRTHSMVLLKNGQVLAAGGEDAGTVASLYDPRTGVWTQTTPMPKPRFSTASIRLPNGQAMFVGGYTPNWEFTNDVQIFNPATGKWRLGAPLPADSVDGLITLTPWGNVLVTGGLVSSRVSIYHPATNTWKVAKSLPSPRWLGNNQNGVTLPDGRFVVPGGATSGTESWTAQVVARNPHTGQWSKLAPLNAPSVHAAVALVGRSQILVAGRYPGSACASVYDPSTNRWTSTPKMPTLGLAYGNPVTLSDGSVLIVGGLELNTTGGFDDTATTMLFTPPSRHPHR